jgi:adenine-specific DNA-methyltransferase
MSNSTAGLFPETQEGRETTPQEKKSSTKRDIQNYVHADKQRVGLVTPDTDRDAGKKTYAYDPHLDPQLVWAGKAEHTSFPVPTVSLHVHERIDPRSIIEAVRKRNGSDPQLSLFATPEENPPIRQAIEFYKHKHNWTNRLIAGDSLLVMNSLLEKEGMARKVQMVYIDPPYGIDSKSRFEKRSLCFSSLMDRYGRAFRKGSEVR